MRWTAMADGSRWLRRSAEMMTRYTIVYYLALQFLGREVRGGLFLALGVVLTTVALVRLNRTVIAALLPQGNARIVDQLYQKRQLSRGPKVVAIGGGTGLSILLAGLKQH